MARNQFTHNKCLNLFVERVDTLKSTSLARGYFANAYEFDQKSTDDDWRSFLVVYRPFMLRDETTNVEFINEIVSSTLKLRLVRKQAEFSTYFGTWTASRSLILWEANGERYWPNDILDYYFYGELFHNDNPTKIEKWKQFKQHPKGLPFAMIRVSLQRQLAALVAMGDFIRTGLQRRWFKLMLGE
jgi:hypothetical protein